MSVFEFRKLIKSRDKIAWIFRARWKGAEGVDLYSISTTYLTLYWSGVILVILGLILMIRKSDHANVAVFLFTKSGWLFILGFLSIVVGGVIRLTLFQRFIETMGIIVKYAAPRSGTWIQLEHESSPAQAEVEKYLHRQWMETKHVKLLSQRKQAKQKKEWAISHLAFRILLPALPDAQHFADHKPRHLRGEKLEDDGESSSEASIVIA